MNAVRTKLKQLVKENGGEKQRSSSAQRKAEGSAKNQAEKHSDLLMRFFESEFFDAWIAVRYVYVLSLYLGLSKADLFVWVCPAVISTRSCREICDNIFVNGCI